MPEELLAAARRVIPEIVANLGRIEAECQLPPELAAKMAQAHLFGMYIPQELGGPEADPLTAFEVVEEVSRVDGSTGWCVFNGTTVSSAVARISPQAAREVFGDPPLVLGSGSARAEGTAQLTDGGYLVSGRWNYLSGIDHSTAVFINCLVLDKDGRPAMAPEGGQLTRTVVVPVAQGQVLDTWHTMGMRGTASKDAEFDGVFVPEAHSYTRGDPAYYPGPLYNPAQTSVVLGWTLSAASTLGMARGAMDTFVDLATGAGTTDSKTLLRDRPQIQIVTGECEAMLDGARTYLLEAARRMWDSQVGQKPDLMERSMRTRLAITQAIRQSVEVVDKLFSAAGTNAIHHGLGLERFFRDLHVHGQHISGLPLNFEFGGSLLLGATPRPSLYT